MPVEINESDEISRCIIFDRAFEASLHVNEMLWRFDNKHEDGSSAESAVLRRLAPDAADVHRIGCGIAAAQNDRRRGSPSEAERRYYCGYRSASVASLPRDGDGYTIVIKNVPEGGEDAHVDVRLYIAVQGRSARANRRTDAGLALAEPFGPPDPHRCECDAQDDQHPFSRWGPDCLFEGLRDRWPQLAYGPKQSPAAISFHPDEDLPLSRPSGL